MEVAVGPDHKVVVELPLEVTVDHVKVTVEGFSNEEKEKPKKRRKLSMKYQGLFKIPDSFFDPLPDEELKLWEEGDL